MSKYKVFYEDQYVDDVDAFDIFHAIQIVSRKNNLDIKKLTAKKWPQ